MITQSMKIRQKIENAHQPGVVMLILTPATPNPSAGIGDMTVTVPAEQSSEFQCGKDVTLTLTPAS